MKIDLEARDLLTFDRMITPMVIQVIYWIALAVVILGAVVSILFSLFDGRFLGVIVGLLWLVLGPIMVRVYCEILIILFRIYGALTDLGDSLQSGGDKRL